MLRVRVWTLNPPQNVRVRVLNSNPLKRVRVRTPLKKWGCGFKPPSKHEGTGTPPLRREGAGRPTSRREGAGTPRWDKTHQFWWRKNEISLKQQMEKISKKWSQYQNKSGHSAKNNIDQIYMNTVSNIWYLDKVPKNLDKMSKKC